MTMNMDTDDDRENTQKRTGMGTNRDYGDAPTGILWIVYNPTYIFLKVMIPGRTMYKRCMICSINYINAVFAVLGPNHQIILKSFES
jgi:hypothetical protein